MSETLQLRRGTEAERLTITPAAGELLFCTDTNRLYVGDGVTLGGNRVADKNGLSAGHRAASRYGIVNFDLFPGATPNFANFCVYSAICVGERTTFAEMGATVSTAGAANVLLSIYDTVNGAPGNQLVTPASFSCATTGVKSLAISATLDAGWYWIALLANASVGQLQATDNLSHPPQIGFDNTGGATQTQAFVEVRGSWTLPATAAPTIRSTSVVPLVFLGTA